VRLCLTKRIPAAAGLGGGSSDAGAVLRALAALAPGALPPGALAALALRLGADVPYFLDPRPALVGGVGERIAPCSGVPARTLLLVNPGLPLATGEVFRAFDALAPPGAPAGGGAPARAGPQAAGAPVAGPSNDLEAAAVRLCPPVARLREALRRVGARAVGMSGSGPTLFGVFDDAAGAEAALSRLGELRARSPLWARVVSTVQS
jgi:4-diphosphocytidyl-2-C-methyl-D-erythritol kinase